MLTEAVVKANLKSLTTALDCQLIHSAVKPQSTWTNVCMAYRNNDLVPGMVYASHITLYIYADGQLQTYGVPNKLVQTIKKWHAALVEKVRQQERTLLYKMDLLMTTALIQEEQRLLATAAAAAAAPGPLLQLQS